MALDQTDIRQAPTQRVATNPYPQGYITPSHAKNLLDYSKALMKNSMGPVPGTKGGWTVGLQHLVEALVGGTSAYNANVGELASRGFDAQNRAQSPSGLPDSTAPATWPVPGARSEDAPSEKKQTALPGGASSYSSEGSPWLDKQFPETPTKETGLPTAKSFAPDGLDAITLALSRASTPKPNPTTPPAVSGTQIAEAENKAVVPPFAVPSRPTYSRKQYELLMGSPWLSEEERALTRGEYMIQNQPQILEHLGGKVIIDPKTGKQFFSPGVKWNTEKGPVGERTVPQILTPPTTNPPATLRTIEEPDKGNVPSGGAGGGPPPSLVPRQGMPGVPSAVPPTVAPTSPAAPIKPVAPAVTPPDRPIWDIESSLPGSAMAFSGDETPGAPQPPPVLDPFNTKTKGKDQSRVPAGGPFMRKSEAPIQDSMIETAQASMAPPPIIPNTPPPAEAFSPMGNSMAAAFSPPPPAAKGEQTAESSAAFHKRMMDEGVEYEGRKQLAKSDAENYAKNLQTYTSTGILANKALQNLEIGTKMVQDPRFYSGVLADPYEWVAKGLTNIPGFDKNLSAPMEVFQKIMSGNIITDLKTLLGGLGQIRLAEIDLIVKSVANKYNTPAANLAVLGMMTRANDHAAKIGRIAAAYDKEPGWVLNDSDQWERRSGLRSNSGLQSVIDGYTQRHRLFTDDEMANIHKVLDIGRPIKNSKIDSSKLHNELVDVTQAVSGRTSSGAATAPNAPKVGDIDDGWRFKGGQPNIPGNWERLNQ